MAVDVWGKILTRHARISFEWVEGEGKAGGVNAEVVCFIDAATRQTRRLLSSLLSTQHPTDLVGSSPEDFVVTRLGSHLEAENYSQGDTLTTGSGSYETSC